MMKKTSLLLLLLLSSIQFSSAQSGKTIYVWQKDSCITIHDVDSITFTLSEKDTREGDSVEYVDLGLSVKWATCNLGATKPEEYGNYYAWGETEPKTDYRWATYKFTEDGNDYVTKYTRSSGLTVLESDDDAATANLGSPWRMPTHAELQELLDKCTYVEETLNGVKGLRVTGTNGNSIFLPAAGDRYDSDTYDAGTMGYYWSSSLVAVDINNDDNAYYLLAYSVSSHASGGQARTRGLTIRPVRP